MGSIASQIANESGRRGFEVFFPANMNKGGMSAVQVTIPLRDYIIFEVLAIVVVCHGPIINFK